MHRNYYSMTQVGNAATINIYGDITSMPWLENDVSSGGLVKQLDKMQNVSEITVYINSYGGEVAEGLAIYNALKRHKARIKTYCDGFAASIASVIFMAGDERIMNDSSLLMIHNAWSIVEGNAQQLRKQADDLEKITQASIIAYKAHATISEEEIVALMDNESWILPEEALQYGFATAIEKTESNNASQNAKMKVLDIIKQHRAALEEEPEDDEGEEDQPEAPETEDDTPENEPPEDDPDDEQEPSEEEETEDGKEPPEEPEDKENPEEAAQQWRGFFNALLKM